jgi:hypothetical protein
VAFGIWLLAFGFKERNINDAPAGDLHQTIKLKNLSCNA